MNIKRKIFSKSMKMGEKAGNRNMFKTAWT